MHCGKNCFHGSRLCMVKGQETIHALISLSFSSSSEYNLQYTLRTPVLVVCPPLPHWNAVEFSLRWALTTVIVATSSLPTRITLAGKFVTKIVSPGKRTARIIAAFGIRHWNVTLLPSVTMMGTSWGLLVGVRITWPVKRQRQMQVNSNHTHEALHAHTHTLTHTHL